MSATIHELPGAWPELPSKPSTLNLDAQELVDASGGYVRPADQLKALHARGFTLAFRGMHGKVVLPRAHYEAVLRGQYGGAPAANEPAERVPLPPNRAGFKAKFGRRKGGA